MKNKLLQIVKKSLEFRLLGVTTILYVGIIILVVNYYPAKEKSHYYQAAREHAEFLVNALSESAEMLLIENNSEAMDKMLSTAKNDTNIEYALLLDQYNNIISEYNPNSLNIAPNALAKGKELFGNERLFFTAPINRNSETLGHAYLVYSMKSVISDINAELAKFILLSSLLLFLGGVMIYKFVKKAKMEEELKRSAESDRLKSEFLAQVSHEIRTPLTSMLGMIDLIHDDYVDEIGHRMDDEFSLVKHSGQRITRTIDLILNMSSVSAGTLKLEPRTVNLNDLLYDQYQKYRFEAHDKNLDFRLLLNSGHPIVKVDEYTTTQIMDNIINNSVKFTRKGKVKILLTENGLFNIIQVKDTGIGITEEYLNSIYKPFSQEETGYSRSYDGNGLGMALVKRLCELNKFDITIESEKGNGTTVTIWLPKQKEKKLFSKKELIHNPATC